MFFPEPVRIVGGPKTRAVIIRPSDKDQPGVEFAYPRLTMRVDPRSIIRNGHVVQLQGGGVYLVAEHSAMGSYHTHHLFRCDRQVEWKRPKTRKDPVTKQLIRGGDPEILGTIWVMWQRERREYADLPIRFSQENTLTATGAAVQLGDFLDGQKVNRLSSALGIHVMELQA